MVIRFYPFHHSPEHRQWENVYPGIYGFDTLVCRLHLVINLTLSNHEVAGFHQGMLLKTVTVFRVHPTCEIEEQISFSNVF